MAIGFAAREFALDCGHADGQEAFALLRTLSTAPLSTVMEPAQLQVVSHPLFAGLLFLGRCDQQGADGFAFGKSQQASWSAAPWR
jgi:hypothetical protein